MFFHTNKNIKFKRFIFIIKFIIKIKKMKNIKLKILLYYTIYNNNL